MVTSGSIPLSDSVDWGTYLARHDLVWDRLPHRWENGVFLGNGLLGTLMHVDLQLNRVRWWICRSDVGRIREREELIGVVNRRVIGSMDLVAVGEFGDPGGDARLGLWDAGAAGSVKTQRGNIGWCCFVPEKPNVLIEQTDERRAARVSRWRRWVVAVCGREAYIRPDRSFSCLVHPMDGSGLGDLINA